MSTIKEADNILVLKYGELKEEGSHESLLQHYPDGIYSNFVKQQEAAEKQEEEEEGEDNGEQPSEDEENGGEFKSCIEKHGMISNKASEVIASGPMK